MENFYTDAQGRVWGNAAIPEYVTIDSSNNTLIISSSENIYTITIPDGSYKSSYVLGESSLIDAINGIVDANSYPLHIYFGGIHKDTKYNVVVCKFKENIPISNISGSFFEAFFV